MEDYRPITEEFRTLMEDRLKEAHWKGGWHDSNIVDLYAQMMKNAASWAVCIEYDNLHVARATAADIVRFAMMVLDLMEEGTHSDRVIR